MTPRRVPTEDVLSRWPVRADGRGVVLQQPSDSDSLKER
jgi:hypothetical protein